MPWTKYFVAVSAALAASALVAASMAAAQVASASPARDRWSAEDIRTLASMRLNAAGARPTDPSNKYAQHAEAAALGQALFNDPRLSGNGQVACGSCHSAENQFEDGRQVGQGMGKGKRRTMPVMGAAHAPFLVWDGRKDSLWSQALGPLEDAAEHGGNRVRLAKLVQAHYASPYQKVFGAMPEFGTLPPDASPSGTDAERAAWAAMPEGSRDAVNRVFANMGKAIAAFEQQVAYGESRFDRYAQATVRGDGRGQEVLTHQEVRGCACSSPKGNASPATTAPC